MSMQRAPYFTVRLGESRPLTPPLVQEAEGAGNRVIRPNNFRGVKSVMFVAGDDTANKPRVIELVAALGFEVVDAGPLRNARLLEAHAMLWIELAIKRGLGRDWAFAIVRR